MLRALINDEVEHFSYVRVCLLSLYILCFNGFLMTFRSYLYIPDNHLLLLICVTNVFSLTETFILTLFLEQ